MALDSRSKRASSVNVLKPYVVALVLPDATLAQGDRQHSAWAYSGVAVEEPGGGGAFVITRRPGQWRVGKRSEWRL